jgi:hypothetical protein
VPCEKLLILQHYLMCGPVSRALKATLFASPLKGELPSGLAACQAGALVGGSKVSAFPIPRCAGHATSS